MGKNKEASYDYYIEQFNKAKSEADAFLRPMDDRTFRRKPSSKAWCVGECFSHLVETGNQYYKKAAKGIDEATEPNSRPGNPMHLRFHMKWFVKYLEPPVTVKSKSPGSFQPVSYSGLDKDEVLNNFLDLQDRYITQLENARSDGLDLSGIYVSNPLISFIKMSAAECIAVTEAHQRRHMEQARNVKKLIEEQY